MEDFTGKFKKQFNYIASRYEFRFNVVTSLYEYRPLKRGKRDPKINWLRYGDRIRSNILVEMYEKDLDLAKDKFDMFVESEHVSPDYNPFLEYFNRIPKWDEKTDYLEQLSSTVETNRPDHFYETLKKFFVGTLDCLLDEDAVNDVCLVFQSGQGLGKTRWMRRLLPPEFQAEYLYEGNIDTRNKDHVMYLSQYWFIHLDELEALKGNEISATKSYITRQRISVRKAFGRYKSQFVRRASFLGSVNDDKFLTDITGNRRWLVFTVKGIDYEHRVDINGVWSQVHYYWTQGYKHWFDIEEIQTINSINEEYRSMSTEEEQLLQLFEIPLDESLGEWLSSTDVVLKIATSRPIMSNKMSPSRMGKALSRHVKLKKNSSGVQKYCVTYIGSEPVLPINKNTDSSGQVSDKSFKEDDDVPF